MAKKEKKSEKKPTGPHIHQGFSKFDKTLSCFVIILFILTLLWAVTH